MCHKRAFLRLPPTLLWNTDNCLFIMQKSVADSATLFMLILIENNFFSCQQRNSDVSNLDQDLEPAEQTEIVSRQLSVSQFDLPERFQNDNSQMSLSG